MTDARPAGVPRTSPHRPPRVLVAEDDPEMRWLVSRALRKDDYDVVEVGDGASLWIAITTRILEEGFVDYDLLVTDVRMPGRSGLDVVETLRAISVGMPIIVMTAFGDDEIRSRVAAISAVLFDKPFDLDDLRTAARILCPTT